MRRTRRPRQGGFSYIEILVGIVVLGIVAGGLAQGLAVTSTSLSKAKVETISGNLAREIVEQAHQMDYDDVGTPGGNPPGIIPATQIRTVDGIDLRADTKVAYVDDPAAGQPQTFVNYKRVAITVTAQSNDGVPIKQTTLIAPPTIGSIAGKSTIIVNVVDALTGDPLSGASVTVDKSTSPTSTDTTDSEGRVVFAGLDPSAVSPSDPEYKYRLTVSLPGYVTHADSDPSLAQQHLAPSQAWETTLRVFRPARIQVDLRDSATGSTITEFSSVTVSTPEPNSLSETASGTSGSFIFDEIAGAPIEPSASNFTVLVNAECHVPRTLAAPVPSGYPATTTGVFDVALDRVTSGDLHVTVLDAETGQPLPSAEVQVSGGSGGMVPRVRAADALGTARFCLEPSGGVEYVVSAGAPGYGAGSMLAVVESGAVTGLTMQLVRGATGTIRLRASGSNQLTRLRALVGTYDASQLTNRFRFADYSDLAAGDYVAYLATGFSGGDPEWSTGKPVTVVAGRRVQYSVP